LGSVVLVKQSGCLLRAAEGVAERGDAGGVAVVDVLGRGLEWDRVASRSASSAATGLDGMDVLQSACTT
jgi:hypothetical protein